MVNKQFPTVFGTLALLAAVFVGPAGAAEGIEAKLEVCATCHGQNGQPIDPKTMPIIWGQFENFLMKQLHDYRAGDRDNAIMKAFAQGLTQEELRPAARYFAGKMWPTRATPAAAASPPPGIAVCRACHQENFQGGAPAPRLAGQSFEYLSAQMRNFADGTRTNNADMVKLMQPLSASDRDAIARYISSL